MEEYLTKEQKRKLVQDWPGPLSKIETLPSGATKASAEGKGRYDLLPPRAMHRLAKRFEFGAKKYSDKDWEKGIPKERLVDSGLRHFFQYMKGDVDEDHLMACCWNLMAIAELEEREKQ